MARSKWTPTTDEHHRLTAEIVEAFQEADEKIAAAWALAAHAARRGLPQNYMADLTGRHRATFQRHLGPVDTEGAPDTPETG